ncbi:hypothetical protein R5R35_009869 [Gryllus longicercus]|uniref:Dynein regulatory complex subunit 2 n=1 Tax=Gryllus longicercus TaxID=2509291 RepID=A0AAN9ZD09_9ORTH
MGKKGKGSRLARMTEEERARYMQHRAALEEEARRRKQQLVATFMRNKLRHEDAFTRLNAAKINQQWRALLRQAKAHELHTELRAARDAFQGTLARQDETVRQLQADLRTAEAQYARGLQSHAAAVDTLIALHELRLEEQYERYRAAREEALAKAEARAAGLREASERANMQLRVATFLNAKELHAFRQERTALHRDAADELRHTLMAELEGMVAGGDWAMERLWRQLRQTLRGYASATDDRRVQLVHLLQRDADDAQAVRAIDQRASQLEVLTGTRQLSSAPLSFMSED